VVGGEAVNVRSIDATGGEVKRDLPLEGLESGSAVDGDSPPARKIVRNRYRYSTELQQTKSHCPYFSEPSTKVYTSKRPPLKTGA